jgi:crotonobetainyl-CoA:carnitine CoA-transferase CaiB-like acyl-CoA transferase
MTARGTFTPFRDNDLGIVRVQAATTRMSATPAQIRHLGPSLGAHNEAVYGGLLGLSSAEMTDLRHSGTI